MMRRRSAWKIALICLAVCAPACGQDTKNELTGMIGRTFISDHRVVTTPSSLLTSGAGLTFEVNYGHRLLGNDVFSLTAEFPFVFNPDEDIRFETNVVPESYRSFFITPSGKVNFFPKTRLSPWVSIGGGFGQFSAAQNLEFGGTNPGKRGTTTGVFQIGAGLDVPVSDRFALRVQVRDFYSGIPQLNVDIGKTRQHNLFVGGGLTWRF